jgi:hypothetical protein
MTCDLQNPKQVVVKSCEFAYSARCVIDDEGVKCWGASAGTGTSTGVTKTPELVRKPNGSPLDDVVSLHAGEDEFCALVEGGTLWCWGAPHPKDYATNIGAVNVVAVGSAFEPTYITDDGEYHSGSTTLSPQCD